MKNQQTIRLVFTGIGALLFNSLFWNESLGINTLLFSTFILGAIFFLHRKEKISPYAKLTAFTTFFSAIMVVINFSFPARLSLTISSMLMVGFLHQQTLKSGLYAVLAAFAGCIQLPKNMWGAFQFKVEDQNDLKRGIRNVKFFVIPIGILSIFFLLFKTANPIFDAWTDQAFDWLSLGFENFFQLFSPARLLFILLGIFVSAWALFSIRNEKIRAYEAAQSEYVTRTNRLKKTRFLQTFSLIALKNENKIGLILMAMVSTMATFVNGIDIVYIWFGFEYDQALNLSQFVHEGTYVLILSILLSMAIMLYYFRGNQNFYAKNERLKWLAYIWIIQNAIMVISVAIRNYHYIHHYGLAYKRIGVIFFLGLTLVGLITLFLKIRDKKSTFFLLRTNTWATYTMLLLLSVVNWDGLIAEHNTSHWNQENMDLEFLLSLSDKALPILDQHRELFKDKGVSPHKWSSLRKNAEEVLDERIYQFQSKQLEHSWLSWTWAESVAHDYFQQKAQFATK